MRLLLDTHIFLWMTAGDRRLTAPGRRLLTNASQIFVSSATIWEIAIKSAINKVKVNPDDAIQEMHINGIIELPVSSAHAANVARLPLIHRDPFDRLLVAQAITEHLQFVTADSKLTSYSALVTLV